MDPDELFDRWIADMKSIRDDIHELFRLRRTFRDVADVFRNNQRLRETGGHVWDWMLLNHVAAVLIRLRRQVDNQNNTVNLKKLLHEIIANPHVISRARRRPRYPVKSELLGGLIDREFTENWVRQPQADRGDDHIDAEILRADLRQLEHTLEGVLQVANRVIAHRARVPAPGVTFGDVDRGFDAIEAVLIKYYALICGSSLMQAEPTPQFNTHEVFTFPWIEGA
jgi:hypothetical protein